MKMPPNTLILCALALAVAACGGRTEVLRQRQARNVADGGVPSDATVRDLGGGSDGGGGSDAGGLFDAFVPDTSACIEGIQVENLTVPEPGDFFSPFRALVDETSFYLDRRNGRSRQIIKRAINGGPEEQLNIEPGAQLLGVANGSILLNNMGGNFPVGIYREGQHVLFNTEGPAQVREGADYQYISGQRAAWINSRRTLFTLDDFGPDGFPQSRGEIEAGPAVAGNVVVWAQRRGREFQLMIDTLGNPTRSVAIEGPPEWMAVSPREVSYVVNGQAWVLQLAGQQRPELIPIADAEVQCVAVVASDEGPVFLCIDEFNDQVGAYFVSRGVASRLVVAPGAMASVAIDGRFFSYVVFPEGESFCPGGSQGTVVVFDLRTSVNYEVGEVTAPCLCCDRIGHAARVQVAGNVVIWTGEGPDLTLEFGAVRMQSVCVDDD